eukprot:TRINITY_DN17022_c0_g6_i1.p1 TRINITY_DN17022_c0_g6~~TRINITY_DN17022_c0_g6_i1.p1  ORF type:complete len:205 (-),score=33.72 TRINITY_DN17022_c0_g6_i1:171-785(-)
MDPKLFFWSARLLLQRNRVSAMNREDGDTGDRVCRSGVRRRTDIVDCGFSSVGAKDQKYRRSTSIEFGMNVLPGVCKVDEITSEKEPKRCHACGQSTNLFVETSVSSAGIQRRSKDSERMRTLYDIPGALRYSLGDEADDEEDSLAPSFSDDVDDDSQSQSHEHDTDEAEDTSPPSFSDDTEDGSQRSSVSSRYGKRPFVGVAF